MKTTIIIDDSATMCLCQFPKDYPAYSDRAHCPATIHYVNGQAELPEKVSVILFKRSGKYYTEEKWRVPAGAIGPFDMQSSPDFRRIDAGAVLIPAQEPWGFPHLFPGN